MLLLTSLNRSWHVSDDVYERWHRKNVQFTIRLRRTGVWNINWCWCELFSCVRRAPQNCGCRGARRAGNSGIIKFTIPHLQVQANLVSLTKGLTSFYSGWHPHTQLRDTRLYWAHVQPRPSIVILFITQKFRFNESGFSYIGWQLTAFSNHKATERCKYNKNFVNLFFYKVKSRMEISIKRVGVMRLTSGAQHLQCFILWRSYISLSGLYLSRFILTVSFELFLRVWDKNNGGAHCLIAVSFEWW